MNMKEAKAKFRKEHPNLRVNGWDERDYELWGQLQSIGSYGLIAGNPQNPMISLRDVIGLLEENAESRFEKELRVQRCVR